MSSTEQEQPWWIKYGARGVGCAGGIIAIILGAFACISLSPICIVAAIWQMLSGFIVVSAEAPFCCMFIDFVDRYSKWVEARPSWQKAALYIGIALPPNFICFFSPSLFFGSGLIFLCGALYGIMAIGKKGNREDMLATAQTSSVPANSQSALVDDPEAWRSS